MLSEYVKIPVNVEEVEAVLRAWLVDIRVYDLLLGVPWMRRVNCTQVYGKNLTIMGNDFWVIDIPSPMIPIDMDFSTIKFDKNEKPLTRHIKIFWTSREKYSSNFSTSKKSELKLIN